MWKTQDRPWSWRKKNSNNLHHPPPHVAQTWNVNYKPSRSLGTYQDAYRCSSATKKNAKKRHIRRRVDACYWQQWFFFFLFVWNLGVQCVITVILTGSSCRGVGAFLALHSLNSANQNDWPVPYYTWLSSRNNGPRYAVQLRELVYAQVVQQCVTIFRKAFVSTRSNVLR